LYFQHFSSLADGLDLTNNYEPLLACLQADSCLLTLPPSMIDDIPVLTTWPTISQRKSFPDPISDVTRSFLLFVSDLSSFLPYLSEISHH
jgi:hypothetical protein